MSVEALSY